MAIPAGYGPIRYAACLTMDTPPRPPLLNYALGFSLFSIAGGAIGLLTNPIPDVGISEATVRALGAGSLAFNLLLLYFISKGRNWARWTFVIMMVLGLLGDIDTQIHAFEVYGDEPLWLVQTLVGTLSIAFMVVVLFLPRTRAWFVDVARSRHAA